jgi:hypothetical protein
LRGAVRTIALSLAFVLPPAADAESAPNTIAEPLPTEPEQARGAVIEVADPAGLALLASRGIDLAHWNEQTPGAATRSIAFVTVWDGYAGASLSCVSDVFAGPSRAAKPRSATSCG